ncbi:HD domain-containing protein [Shewanella sp. JM162201]|uniref:HD domain-containing protein n=1 Tax=Shewanella jiangmenensis TaxID=2837387 RepID=A0ABS5V0E0_9GAMM|nr:HD domain-containing phosphohydrolase [Shewanella jiangmenensis]MBT1443345.1 HD domain-containing protein [Shewanella jiangmenensis]
MSSLTLDEQPADLAHWRQIIFRRMFTVLAIICIPVYFTSVYLCMKQGLWSMVVVDTLAYLTLLALLLFPEINDTPRYTAAGLLCYAIGVAFIWAIGPTGAGFFWLFMFPLVTTLLLGSSAGVKAQLLCVITLLFTGIGYYEGLMPWPPLPAYSLEIFAVVSVNFIAICAMLCFGTGYLTDRLSLALERTHASRRATIRGLARLSGLRSHGQGDHLDRIAAGSRALAQALERSPHRPDELTGEFIEHIGLSATLHDVGMVALPDILQNKLAQLTPSQELERVRHTQFGEKLLAELQAEAPDCLLLSLARNIAASHHERWDGDGYPGRLKGKAIPLEARIVTLIDTFDDLLCHPDERLRLGYEQALRHLKGLKGSMLDPLLVDTFLATPQMRDIWTQSQIKQPS